MSEEKLYMVKNDKGYYWDDELSTQVQLFTHEDF